nr:hypothetical protein [Tanacetum cinerariifolium]
MHVVGGSRTSSSKTNNSMHLTQMVAIPRSKPLPTIPILSGIWSSSSTIGNTSGLSNVSTSVQRGLDRRTQDRFIKIGLLTARYVLNCKELKVDDYKPNINNPSSQMNHPLTNSNDNETLIDETCKMPLSMSNASGNVNLCKTRILKFVKEAHSYRAGNRRYSSPGYRTHVCSGVLLFATTISKATGEYDGAWKCSWNGGNIVGVNSTVGGQGSGNVRRGAPRAGRKGASPLAIFDLNPMETKPRIVLEKNKQENDKIGTKPDQIKKKREAWKSATMSKVRQSRESRKEKKYRVKGPILTNPSS